MKYFLLIFIVIINSSIFGYTQVESKLYNIFLNSIYHKQTPTLSCDSLHTNFDEYLIIDTRSDEEYQVSHLENAQYLNYDELENVDLVSYQKDKPILFYCSVGWRSQKVAEHFIKAGFSKVYNLYGGIFEWSNKCGYTKELKFINN